MKNLLLLLILSLLPFTQHSVSAQQTGIDQKIIDVYGASFAANNPGMYQKMHKLLQERVRYQRMAETPDEKFTKLSQVALLNKNNPGLTRDQNFVNADNFNPLKYDLNFYAKTTQVYRFDNTDILVIIDPL